MSNIIFRAMEMEDLPRVKQIEAASFSAPWSMQAFMHELRENSFAHYVVGMVDNNIAAYCGSWVVLDEAQITTIATHPHYRGRGLGEAILRYVMARLIKKGAKSLFLEVRVTNTHAQKLYTKLGFEKVGMREKYYEDNLEDAIVMGVKNLDERRETTPRTRD